MLRYIHKRNAVYQFKNAYNFVILRSIHSCRMHRKRSRRIHIKIKTWFLQGWDRDRERKGRSKETCLFYCVICFTLYWVHVLFVKLIEVFLKGKKIKNFILSHKTLNEEGNRDITQVKCLNLKMKILVLKDLTLQKKKYFLCPTL